MPWNVKTRPETLVFWISSGANRLTNCDVKGFHFPLFPPIPNRLNNKELQKGILDLYNMSICWHENTCQWTNSVWALVILWVEFIMIISISMNFCCLKNNEHNTDVLSTQGLIVWMSRLEISASSFIFFVNSIYTSD